MNRKLFPNPSDSQPITHIQRPPYIITAAMTAAARGIEAIIEILLDASIGPAAAEVMLVK